MGLVIKKYQVNFDFSSITVALLMVSWSAYYYFSILADTEEGAESVLFIKPIFVCILLCFPFVVWSAISIKPSEKPAPESSKRQEPRDRGLLDSRRIFFTSALVGYAAAITFFGYLIPSALFIFIVSYYLGSRSLWILLVLPIGLSVFLSVVFRMVLMVPIDIWPSW